MTEPDTIAAVSEILAEELAEITEPMIEAASRAAEAVSVEIGPDGKRRLRMCSEAQLHAAVWRAMLAAKLGACTTAALPSSDFPVPEHLKG